MRFRGHSELPGHKCPFCEKPARLDRKGRVTRHRGLNRHPCPVAGRTLGEARAFARAQTNAWLEEFGRDRIDGFSDEDV